MRPLEEKLKSNCHSILRSGEDNSRALEFSGDAKMKKGDNLIPQDGTFTVDSVISVHDFQTLAETLECETQVLDDFTDGFISELDDAIYDIQVLDVSEDTSHQAKRASLDVELPISSEHNDNTDSGLDDIEGSTQIVDDLEDMSRTPLENSGTAAEVIEHMACGENSCTHILSDHSEQLFTKSLVTTSDERTALWSRTSGYVPPRITELRVKAWLEYGLEVKTRALSGNTAGSVSTIPAKQKVVDKDNYILVKGSPSNMEGTDDEDFISFNEPKDGRKVRNSAVRKLFAEDLVPRTEKAYGIISTGDDESEPPAGEGGADAAGLSYINSQEPNDLAHAKALDFVEKFLTDNLIHIDTNDHGSTRVKKTDAVAHSNSKQSSKKSILRNFVGFSKEFDWDDYNEDEGGGAFFCKLKEKTSQKQVDFHKSALPIEKFNQANSTQPDKVSERSRANGRKRRLSYSETGIVSLNVKNTAKKIEENAKENVINVRNRDCTGNNDPRQNTPDMRIAWKDVSAGTSAVQESHAGRDTYLLNTKEIGHSEGVSMGRTRRGSYIKILNIKKKARPSSDMVIDNSTQSLQIPTRWEKGMTQDATSQIQDAKLIEQPMEVSTCAVKTAAISGNDHVPTIDPGQKGQVDQVKPTQSKARASSRSNIGQVHHILNKNAIPRRSCRLKKVTKLDLPKQQLVKHHIQFEPISHNKIVGEGEPMNISSNQQRIPLRRSRRLNGSSTLEDLSLHEINKPASAVATKNQLGMQVSLDSAPRQPLLQKRRVFITPNTKPGKEVIACLVKSVGGQVVGRITGSALRYHNIHDSILILTCEEDFAICEPFIEKGAKVYSSELLLNGIVTQRLEYERYRLFDDRGKRTTTRHNAR